jgi:hypothetical protein
VFANINDVVLYINLILNKNQAGSLNGNEVSLALNVAQQEYLRIKIGLPEQFTTDRREAPQQFQVAQVISDAVLPFIVSQTINKNGNGFDIPANFAAWANDDYIEVVQNNGQNVVRTQPIEFVTLGERALRLSDYINYPTIEYPVATYMNSQILINPDTISRINLQYIRLPITPKWAFTVNADDQEVYDPANSVQLEFRNIEWQNIANLAIKYYSMFLRDGESYQAINQMIKEGA